MCEKSGAAQVEQGGIFSTLLSTGSKYVSRFLQEGVLTPLNSAFGFNRLSPCMPYLAQCPVDSGNVKAIFDPCKQSEFAPGGLGGFTSLFGSLMKLVFDSLTCKFICTECNGNAWYFSRLGSFLQANLADGHSITADYDINERMTSLEQTVTVNAQPVTDRVIFEYIESGPNADRIHTCTSIRTAGSTTSIRRMVYDYYTSGDEHGTTGDLRTATEQIMSGTTWVDHDTSYYRYYLNGAALGFEHGLRYALGPDAYARLVEDPQVSDPFLATDAQVARYANNYFEYNADQRVTRSVTNAGLFTYLFDYTLSANDEDPNEWILKIVTTQPDGSTVTRYNNFLGQTMLADLAEGSDHWLNFFQYDANFREVVHASPSAVISYDEGQPDLDVSLQSASGLLNLTNYYATTTATPTTPGGAEGHVESTQLQEGTGGTPITQLELDYFQRTDGIAAIYPIANSTIYRDNAGTQPITTSFAYTWQGSTIQIDQRTTTLSAVPTSQNGTNTIDTITQIFDELTNLIWQRDPRGFINFNAYDLPTGSVIQSIQDVDGAKLTLPNGWVTPGGGGLHLVTDYEVDALGRTTQRLGPEHEVLGEMARTASWTVFHDLLDEVWSAQGYATGEAPEYVYTLVNPVAIQATSHDGRVSQSITAVRDCGPRQNVEVPDAGTVESLGRLSASDCFPQTNWVRWSVSFTNDQGQAISSRIYHHIPASGEGLLNANYDETRFGFDIMGRQNRVVSTTGTISRTVFEVRGLMIESWLGTDDRYSTDDDPSGGGAAGNNMVQISANEYDNGAAGGDGNLTEQTAFVNDSTERVTAFTNDFRGRRVTTDGDVDFFQELFYNNLNQVIQVDRRNTNSGGNLIARSETLFDNRGQVYQTIRYAVNPSTGSVGNMLVDNTWHDQGGNAICVLPAGSNAFMKRVFDGIGRVPASYTGYNPDAEIDPSSVTDDKIFEQNTTVFDAASNVLMTTSSQRFHDATGLGPLNGPSGSQPRSRDSFAAMWPDGIGRTLASANYGTNDNAGPPTRPATPPASSELILVSKKNYNERGEAFESIDPAGKVDRSNADDAGRTVLTLQNYKPSSPPGCLCPGSEQNVATEMRYGPGTQLVALIAKNPDTGDQVTQYQYGVTLADSDLASNDLLRAEIYPDSAESADRVRFTYNRQGQRTSMRDQNGSVHEYAFDLLGRPTADAVTTLGMPSLTLVIDDAILRIGRTYEVRGMVEKITSYDAASGGGVVNEVQNTYNDFAQLKTQYQEHAGAVNTGTSPKVEYAYENGSANTIRPTAMTYPSGQVLQDLYDDTDADNLSRIRTLNFDGDDVAQYAYLGMGTFVTTDYPQPQIKLDYAGGSGANPYIGFDQFGRVIDLLWQSYATSSSSSSSSSSGGEPPGLVHLQYTYDPASNRTSRADLIAQWYDKDFDELYEYDGMHRLKKFHRGRLVESDTVIESPTLQQGWRLDATGNWRNFTQNDQADPTQTLDQQRLSNRVNEITQIARTVGANWVTPEYDRNGNMTLIPQPKNPTLHYHGTWDAWNRLVILKEPDGANGWQTLEENTYNGQAWRILRNSFTGGSIDESRMLYYSSQWQVIEERLAGEAAPDQQSAWGRRYIDDLIVRQQNNESFYALQDAIWNVASIVTEDLNQSRFSFEPYGFSNCYDGHFNPSNEGAFWKARFVGRDIGIESQLIDFRWRISNPRIGDFLSRDPVKYHGGTSNLYEYCNSRVTIVLDPFGLGPEELYIREADCDVAMKERKVMLGKLNQLLTKDQMAKGRASGKDNCPGPDCELITFVIELGHSCSKFLAGNLIGHTGIAIGNDYYDYGPGDKKKGAIVGPATQWWDNPAKNPGNATPDDVGLDDILRNIKTLTEGGNRDVIVFNWCIPAKQGGEIRARWKDLYKKIKEGTATYSIPGDQCTSVAWRAVNGKVLVEPLDLDELSPEGWLKALAGLTVEGGGLRHTCGPKSGAYVLYESIQRESDPYASLKPPKIEIPE